MAEVDVIIPTIPGREESLGRLSASLKKHSGKLDYDEIIIEGSKTCGWGWQKGLRMSKAPYVWLAADDLEVASPFWFQVAKRVVDAGKIPCPRVYTPGLTIESQGGDMHSFEHLVKRPRANGAKVDFTTVPFLNREQVEAIEILPIQYCCDVYVSYRGRQLGYETVLVHGYDLIHHQEQVGRGAGMSQNTRNEIDCRAMYEALARG